PPLAAPTGRDCSRNQAGGEICGPYPLCSAAIVGAAIGGTRRIGRPMRRAQTLDAAAFLVHQHGRITPDCLAGPCRPAAPLRRRPALAPEAHAAPPLP